MSERHDLIKTSIDSLLLSLLDEQPMYGYQIIKELGGRSQGYFRFKEGTLYPALHRMEKAGLVEGSWKTLASGQHRKYYRITAKGSLVLGDTKSSWSEFLNAMNLIILGKVNQPSVQGS